MTGFIKIQVIPHLLQIENPFIWRHLLLTSFIDKDGRAKTDSNLDSFALHCKGQLISKCPFCVIVWTKIPTKFFPGFLP